MNRAMSGLCAASLLAFAPATQAMPPEPVPINPATAPRLGLSHYFDDVEGLARLAWQATRCADEQERLAAVEQMVRCCVHPRRVDTVLATVENNDPNTVIRTAARRIRVQLRLETANMAWIERENQDAHGRSVVAHDPIPYREALASLRTTADGSCATCGGLTPSSTPLANRIDR